MLPSFGYVGIYSSNWVMAAKVRSVAEACWGPVALRATISLLPMAYA